MRKIPESAKKEKITKDSQFFKLSKDKKSVKCILCQENLKICYVSERNRHSKVKKHKNALIIHFSAKKELLELKKKFREMIVSLFCGSNIALRKLDSQFLKNKLKELI